MRAPKEKKKRPRRQSRRVASSPQIKFALSFCNLNHHKMYPFEKKPSGLFQSVCRRCGYTIQTEEIEETIIMTGYAMKFPCPVITNSMMLPPSETPLNTLDWNIIQDRESEVEKTEIIEDEESPNGEDQDNEDSDEDEDSVESEEDEV